MRRTLIGIAAMTAAAQVGGFAHGRASAAQFMQLYDYGHERKWPAAETLMRKMAEIAGVPTPTRMDNFPEPFLPEPFAAFRAVGAALEPFYAPDQPGDPTYDELMFPKAEPAVRIDGEIEHYLTKAGVASLDEMVQFALDGKRLLTTVQDLRAVQSGIDAALAELSVTTADELIEVVNLLREAAAEAAQVNKAAKDLGLADVEELVQMAKLGKSQQDLDEAERIAALQFVDANIQRLEKKIEAGEPDMDQNSVEARTKAGQQAMDEEISRAMGDGDGGVETDTVERTDPPGAAATDPDPAAPEPAETVAVDDPAPARKKRT